MKHFRRCHVSKTSLGRSLWLVASVLIAASPARAADCAAPKLLLERFISAECEACWQAVPPIPTPTQSGTPFVLDWIVPSARNDPAPWSALAVPEATPRAARAGSLRNDEVLTQSTPLPARSALRLTVEDGPAWNGYVALKLEASYGSSRALPPGLAAYLALVERIGAGDDGSPVARQVVRTVIGPLPLDGLAQGRKVDHLRATKLPATTKPERLSVVGWLETPAGRVLAIAGRGEPGCKRDK
jgi:hypothetical protein